MSLRYKLNKEMFKGKKLPPKIKTNEDHISPDQRGSSGSDDKDPFSDHNVKNAIKQSIEQDMVSRRGLIGGLNKLKDYAEQSEKQPEPKKGVKRRRVKLKPPEDEEGEENPVDGEAAEWETPTAELEAPATEDELESPSESEEDEAPKKGFFRRVAQRFYPAIEDPEEVAARKQKKEENKALKKALAEAKKAKTGGGEDGSDGTVPENISPVTGLPLTEEEAEEGTDMSRRHLIRQGLHYIAKPTVNSIQKKIDKVNTTVDKFTKRVPLLRPPGAIEERAFLQACTRCDKCIHACPKDAIMKVPKKHGFLIMDTPFIDPVKVPCVMCTDLPCISACPDQALLPVPGGPTEVAMGYAILDKKKCQAYGDGFCQQCVIDCPIPGAITQKNQLPTIHKDVCTGCGVCVRSCSTVNIPVAIKIKPQMVIDWQARKKAMEEKEKEMAAQHALEEQQKALEAQQQAEDSPDAVAETASESPSPDNEPAE